MASVLTTTHKDANGVPTWTQTIAITSTSQSTLHSSESLTTVTSTSSSSSPNLGAPSGAAVQSQPSNSESTIPLISSSGIVSSSTTGYGTGRHNTTSPIVKPTAETDSSSTSSTGVSAGAVAGIAIGCLVVGLIIGLLGACILLRRKGRRNETGDTAVVHHEPKGYGGKTSPATTSPHVSDIQLNQFLLEATPDRDIAREVQSLGELIRQHVETYYHSKPVNASIQGLCGYLEFPGLDSNSSLDLRSIALLCLDPKTRQTGLRHVILRTAFTSIDFHSRYGRLQYMLPQPIDSFLRTMPPDGTVRNDDPQVTSLALRKWRTLSAFLLHPSRNLRTPLPINEMTVSGQARSLAESLFMFLQVFVEMDPGVVKQQESHLQAVFVECAKFGHVLLSQPSDWGLVTDVTCTTHGVQAVVVEAGLNKLSDRDGPPYSCAQSVVEPVVVNCTTQTVDA